MPITSIAVFFDAPSQSGYPLNESEYVTAYKEFAQELETRDAKLWVVRTQESYLGGNRFRNGWVYEQGELVPVIGVVEPDLIYNKGNLVWDESARVINVRDVELLCTDKSRTYMLFAEHSPRSRVVHSAEQLSNALAELGGTRLVAKPLDKEGGMGVIIDTPEAIQAAVHTFPYIVQEFIDTSSGIPGMMTGHHDLRIASINGHITHCYYRTPPKGSLLANVARGGEMHFLTEKEIPEGAMKLYKSVEEHMKRYPERIYSVDMGRNIDGRWMIIELNSKPGILPRYHHAGTVHFQEELASMLTRIARAEPSHAL